ncbi:MAG: hypothetical protein IJ555_01710 [Ruminococcus sp.]|nr:hypothetical protein [Ruminococcus sp.]
MYSTSNAAVAERIESYSRTWRIVLEDDDDIFMGENIMSAESSLQSTSLSDDIELGAVCSAQWTVELNGVDSEFLGKKFDLSFYLVDYSHGYTTYGDLTHYTWGELRRFTVAQVSMLGEILEREFIPMGHFTCVRSKKTGAATEITLADALYFSDREYIPRVRFPATGQAIEDDICSQLGIENGNDYTAAPYLYDIEGRPLYDDRGRRLRSSGFDFTIRSKGRIPKGTTMRQMLGYIASAHGQFGFIDRFGRYVRKWYGQSAKTLDNNTIDLPTISEQQNVITGIVCTVSDELTLTLGDDTGRVLEFGNPFMTPSLLSSLWFRVQGYSWYTVDLYHRLGDPRFDIGDVITYNDGSNAYEIPITTLDFSFDGGLSANIAAVGLNVEEQTI